MRTCRVDDESAATRGSERGAAAVVTTTRRPRLRPSRPVSACSLLLRALFSCGAESRDGEQGDAWCWISCVSVGRVAGRARFGGPPARQLVLARRIQLTRDDQLRRLRRVRNAPRPVTTCRALEPCRLGSQRDQRDVLQAKASKAGSSAWSCRLLGAASASDSRRRHRRKCAASLRTRPPTPKWRAQGPTRRPCGRAGRRGRRTPPRRPLHRRRRRRGRAAPLTESTSS
mmetsp:Transcript_16234/g.52873  ORF Transcript_16234/g.52873 Transcript_16234/m.52873 type:complete len:229 (+) Transcript_16234:110-796(+)